MKNFNKPYKILRKFEPEIRMWLMRKMKEAATPADFSRELSKLEAKLEKLHFVNEYYQRDWHPRECMCDECLRREV